MTNKFNGFGDQIPLNDDYYTYFKGLLRTSGDIEGSNVLFNEITSKNFYGIQPSLVKSSKGSVIDQFFYYVKKVHRPFISIDFL